MLFFGCFALFYFLETRLQVFQEGLNLTPLPRMILNFSLLLMLTLLMPSARSAGLLCCGTKTARLFSVYSPRCTSRNPCFY